MGSICSCCSGESEENRHIETIEEHQDSINCLAVSDDKYHSVLTTGCEDGTLRMYSTNDDTDPIGILTDGHTSYVTCVICVSIVDDEGSEKTWIFSGGADNSICKWDPVSMECVYKYRGHRGRISRVLSTGDYIFSSSSDKTAKMWKFNAEDENEEDSFQQSREKPFEEDDSTVLVKTFEGHTLGVFSLIFKPGDNGKPFEENIFHNQQHIDVGDLLFTGSVDNTAKCWSVFSGQMIRTFKGHRGAITCMSMDFDEEILYTGSSDTDVRSWNIETGACLKVFDGHNHKVVCLEVVNRLMYTGDEKGYIRCSVRSGGDLLVAFQGHHHAIIRLKLHDRILYSGSADRTVKAFDAASGKLMYTFKGHRGPVSCMTLGIDKLYSGSSDGTLMVWSTAGLKGRTNKKTPDERCDSAASEKEIPPSVYINDGLEFEQGKL